MADDLFKKRQKEANSYQAQEAAKYANMLRLRAERLAREAASIKADDDKPKTRKRAIRK